MADATILQHELRLTNREYQVLDYVRSHRPRPIPCDEINDAVFGRFAAESNTRFVIHQLRRKLGPGVLITVHGFGVRFGLGKVVEANPRCPDCGRAIARYEDEWTCYGCGASGSRKQLERVELDVGRSDAEGARGGKAWTAEEEQFVRENWATMTHSQIAEQVERSARAVRGLAEMRGYGKKPYVLSQPRPK